MRQTHQRKGVRRMTVKVQFFTYRWNIREASWTLAKKEEKEYPDVWQAHRATVELIEYNNVRKFAETGI